MTEKTFTQRLVEQSAPTPAERLWSGSCPIKRPLFRDLPPTIQQAWARSGNVNAQSDDPLLHLKAQMAVEQIIAEAKAQRDEGTVEL